MKHQKFSNLFFTLCFLAFLFIGMALTVLKPKLATSFYENRALAAVPSFSRDSLMSGDWFAGWETYLKDHAAGRSTLLKASSALDLFVFKRPVVNDTVITDKHLLSFNGYEAVDSEKIAGQSALMTDSLKSLDSMIRQYGGYFVYVAVPGQTAYFEDEYPDYLDNASVLTETVLTAFESDMTARAVPFVDMGAVFDGLGHPDAFYSATDHHYRFEGAFKTYETIMAHINGAAGLSLPVLADGDYTVETLENPFLGSRARKIFNLIPSPEKLRIAVLKTEIPFTRVDDGTVEVPFIYSLPQNAWDTVTYDVYMGWDAGETVLKTDRPGLPDVLIAGDSYTNAVECLLYTGFNEMRSLDLRSYTEKTLAEYVSEYQPDVVILLRDYSVLLSPDGNGTVF